MQLWIRGIIAALLLGPWSEAQPPEYGLTETNSLAMPKVGEHQLRILTPQVLELTLVNSKQEGAPPTTWDFVGEEFALKLPPASEFQVSAGGKTLSVRRVGFKRRPIYAPLKERDLRIANHLYLELSAGIAQGTKVEVRHTSGKLWPNQLQFQAKADPMRFNPAIHLNQVGYHPNFPKKAMVGYYLGSLGEMKIDAEAGFELLDASTGKAVHRGELKVSSDRGFTYTPAPYQSVYEADFSKFNKPGIYRLAVPGLGASFPFQIHEGTLAAFARTYALGLYHQRCGTNNVLPFTRHVHEPCHIAPAEVPDKSFKQAQSVIEEVSSGAKDDPRHTAPQLKNSDASLYPFIRTGKIEVSGGHHDAGDYSKYTINSAGLIHALVFAADNFEGAGALDNLGLPESRDRKSDLLQEAKWEADFLAKLQDKDGGFYFLVYPKARRYEDNVLPDKGDPQIVWPKNTSATAAAVAALAECGSSPLFKKQFPAAADMYTTRALRGWAFLERALAKHGKDGSYQKLTHYGNEFLHDDELAWAAAALFAATGKKEFEQRLKEWFSPEDKGTRRWSWWPMFEGYGAAIRTYVFSARNGKRKADEMDAAFVTRCESLIHETAQNHARFSRESAYGVSFPDPNKANRNAGWFFPSERAFDMTVAWQLRKDEPLREAILGNLNYEAGCNPINISYITGIGWQRQREIVHQYAQNDYRLLPLSGIPIGAIQGGFAYLHHYKKELGQIPFPPDGGETAPYPFYDRWGDSFNTSTEFVVMDQARSLASLAYWMAQTEVKNQEWRSATGQITGLSSRNTAVGDVLTAALSVQGIKDPPLQIVWEARDHEPVIGASFPIRPQNVGAQWVEAEAMWPDGRRVFASTSFVASASMKTAPNVFRSQRHQLSPEVVALYHLDGTVKDETGRNADLKLSGNAAFDQGNLGWMKERRGAVLRFEGLGDKATAAINLGPHGSINGISLEAMIYINDYRGYNKTNAKILSLSEDWNSTVEFMENIYEGPTIKGGTKLSIKKDGINQALTPTNWHHLAISVDHSGYVARVNGKVIGSASEAELANWGRKPAILEIGNFDGYVDEVAITVKSEGAGIKPPPAASLAASERAAPKTASQERKPARKFRVGKSNAVWMGEDSATKGDWQKNYGKLGYKIIGAAEQMRGSIMAEGVKSYAWSESTTDPRALRKPGGDHAVAACWYDEQEFAITVSPEANGPVELSLYSLDWDRAGRVQSVEIRDAATGEVLDNATVAEFGEGKYVKWLISNPVKISFRKESGPNALLMGVFLDPPSAEALRMMKQK